MTTTLPFSLVAEVRLAFRQSVLQRRTTPVRNLSTTVPLRFKATPTKCLPRAQHDSVTETQETGGRTHPPKQTSLRAQQQNPKHSTIPASHRTLVPREQDGQAVGSRRTTDAPMKVIPKADLTPNLRLSPRERLHIEVLTRRPPPQIKQVKPYKERLLIYHHGNVTTNALVFLKVSCLLCASVMTVIYVPAHYFAGASPWLCASLLVGGFTPVALFHQILKPMVTRIYLRLPPNARASPDAAMKYARNLPSSAQIDIDFARASALPGTITANLADIQPLTPSFRWPWQIANLRWVSDRVDKGSLFRRNPTEFYVRREVGAGRVKRDVIPGIWPEVYKRLTGVVQEELNKWRKH